MFIRQAFVIALVMSCIVPAAAKTVQTNTFTVTPMTAPPASGSVPENAQPDGNTVRSTISPEDGPSQPAAFPNTDLPQVFYDTSLLPKPVARMHAQLYEAALSANMERLRMILESNEVPPTLSLTEVDKDPIAFLKESSGDEAGLEILAILADTLDAGFIHADAGTVHEMYIWPYFARYPFSSLTSEQKVEMYRLVTAADYTEMETFGVWLFYRVGIGPDGTLHYFVAGE